MKKYEIINPSDKCFIESEDVKVAQFCCLVLGNGMYALRCVETDKLVSSFYLSGISEQHLNELFNGGIDKFIKENCQAISDCFKTFSYAGEQTSLNNIGSMAARYAKQFEVAHD